MDYPPPLAGLLACLLFAVLVAAVGLLKWRSESAFRRLLRISAFSGSGRGLRRLNDRLYLVSLESGRMLFSAESLFVVRLGQRRLPVMRGGTGFLSFPGKSGCPWKSRGCFFALLPRSRSGWARRYPDVLREAVAGSRDTVYWVDLVALDRSSGSSGNAPGSLPGL